MVARARLLSSCRQPWLLPTQNSSRLAAFLLFPARSPRSDEWSAASPPPRKISFVRGGHRAATLASAMRAAIWQPSQASRFGQDERERAAAAGVALELDAAFVGFHDVLDDGKAEAGALSLA